MDWIKIREAIDSGSNVIVMLENEKDVVKDSALIPLVYIVEVLF